jgi:hypothetical protein
VPEAAGERDVVVGLAEPLDVAAGIAQQPRGVQQVRAACSGAFLGILAPLAAEDAAAGLISSVIPLSLS